ncbi:peptidase inhibitor family I36 protein [Streptomyces sp. NPDC058603]|uniref:peptidase inhibitor family I36 protein n=1 Tax=unclassified Streptomyces TaxID=2593676 RepID=UPI00364E94A0
MIDPTAQAKEEITMRRALVSIVSVGFAATLTLVGPATTASAGTADCPRGYLCVWEHPNYEGRMFKFGGSNASWGSWDIEDKDSSWYNNGTEGMIACVWSARNYQGTVKAIQPQTSSPSDAIHGDNGSSNNWAHLWC